MEKNWINNILDAAVEEVRSWPSWMQQGQVRATEATSSLPKDGITSFREQKLASDCKCTAS